MMALPSFVEILFVGVGFLFLPVGSPVAAGELEERLFAACEEDYSYEMASWVLDAGADPNAVSPSGDTPVQMLLRARFKSGRYGRYDDSMVMLALLLKYGARLPESAPPEDNPVRWVMGHMDQIAWDLLALKFGEAELLRYAGWPTEPAATIASGTASIAVPPPDGFVPAPAGVEKLLALASKNALQPEAAMFFVPAQQADLPLADITVAAAFIGRHDLLGLGGEELYNALSVNNETTGGSYTQYFNNAQYTTVSPTGAVPWVGGEPDRDKEKFMVSSNGSLGAGAPYQLLYYTAEDDENFSDADLPHGLLGAWHCALRAANPR